MRIFLDTNVFLRYLVVENITAHENCKKLISTIQSGRMTPFTSNVVFQEILYILIKEYNFSKPHIVVEISKLLNLRNLTIVETTRTAQALALYQKYNIKFGDCLIATQVPNGVILCTYDTDFSKIPFLEVKSPAQILSQLKASPV